MPDYFGSGANIIAVHIPTLSHQPSLSTAGITMREFMNLFVFGEFDPWLSERSRRDS